MERVQNSGKATEILNQKGELSAWQRIEYLVDPGTWCPLHTIYDPANNEEQNTLLEDIANVRGLGVILSQGIKHASKVWDLEDIAIHVKDLEPPGYDPRVLKGMGLAYATSTRGACHLRATFYKAELSGLIDPSITKGKAEMFIDFENRLTLFNAQILCVFYRELILWPELRQFVKALTGWDYTQLELEEIANRIVTLTKIFNLREGAMREQDTLPKRMFKEPLNEGRDVITVEELDLMLDDYYKLRGWDSHGRPSE